MFHFALKIKRPEVAGGTSFRPAGECSVLGLESSAKRLVFDCTPLSGFYAASAVKALTDSEGDTDD
jgi:hypothetical protein